MGELIEEPATIAGFDDAVTIKDRSIVSDFLQIKCYPPKRRLPGDAAALISQAAFLHIFRTSCSMDQSFPTARGEAVLNRIA